MAPRSEFLAENGNLVEFKPRVGQWASNDAWSSPKLQMESRSKTVRFARNETKVIAYMHVNEYTAEEKQACFYRRADFKAMRAHNAAVVDQLSRHQPLDESESNFGLETRTPRENLYCHQMMRQAMLAVLDEQEDQWRYDGYVDDEILASRYMTYTWEAKERALSLGQSQMVH